MNPYEVERLDFDNFKGIPIVPNEKLGTGRFRVICDGMADDDDAQITEAVSPSTVAA